MTEGPPYQHEKPMCIRIWLEVGHACEPRQSASGRALSLDWRVWVRGARGDISAFVHKVVFDLHPPSAFVYPKRVLQEPPYEIKESGCASIDIPIHVYLKFSHKPKKICLRYSLHIENNNKASSESRCVYYDFENPSETLFGALMKGGGELIARTGGFDRAGKLVVLFDDDLPATKMKRYKYVKPIRCKHSAKRLAKPCTLDEVCPKCGESINADFRKQLRAVAMTEDEINRVSQLYLSYGSYEKSANALKLPPLSDAIYSVPELPPSLRGALASVEADYAMQ
ncbi:YEATS domain-containing protein 4-like isoform X1 [Maniola hyperantus]|uniref:YEATS domain-containing protein 4-like isoform X1 n=2 Tax=Aphantopus hyperantus TaxID=2795564 RepID=UPI001568D6EE|nr:YEATS domain-containing protein 4-like isoform X1 [Maniola hyperantus]